MPWRSQSHLCTAIVFVATKCWQLLSFLLFSWNNDTFLLKKPWFEKCWAGQSLIALVGVVNDLEESHTFLCGVPRIIINNFVTYNDFLIASLLERKGLTLNTGYLRSLFMRIQHQIKCLLPWKRFLVMWSYGHVLCWFSFVLLLFLSWPVKPVNALLTGWFLSTYWVSKLSAAVSCTELSVLHISFVGCEVQRRSGVIPRWSVSSIKTVSAHLCANRLGRVCIWAQMIHLLTQAVRSDLSCISYPAEAGDQSIAVPPTWEPNLDQSCSGLGVTGTKSGFNVELNWHTHVW